MIQVEKIKEIVTEKMSGTGKFIVNISIVPHNRIIVEIDSPAGINISDCTELHRFIENKLDRDTEDFELTVSSPGLEEPFKVFEQYRKNIGRTVRIIQKTGIVTEGSLADAGPEGVEIRREIKEKINGKKQMVIHSVPIGFDMIKETKLVL